MKRAQEKSSLGQVNHAYNGKTDVCWNPPIFSLEEWKVNIYLSR